MREQTQKDFIDRILENSLLISPRCIANDSDHISIMYGYSDLKRKERNARKKRARLERKNKQQ